MANEELVNQFAENIKKAIELSKKGLFERTSEWGSINFNQAKGDIDEIISIISSLDSLPVDLLPDSVIKSTNNIISQIIDQFSKIDSYSLEQDSHIQLRDGIINSIKNLREQITSNCGQWLPFLFYQKGDAARNIKELAQAKQDCMTLFKTSQDSLKRELEEARSIVENARKTAIEVGAAHFSNHFRDESSKSGKKSKWWLIASSVLSIATIIAAIFSYFIPLPQNSDALVITHLALSKFTVLGILFWGAVWCGGIYKALKHQQIVNKHRALSILTLRAFRDSAKDDAAQDAVVMEAARAVFGSVPTGMLGAKENIDTGGMQILDRFMPVMMSQK